MFLGFLRIAAVEVPCGTDPTIQIFDDDVAAFTRLIALLLLISATFPYLCDCRLGDAEAYHADGNCHTNQCNSDTAQSLLPDVHRLSVPSRRSAPQLAEAIKNGFPQDHLAISDTQWLVSTAATAPEVAARINVYDPTNPNRPPTGNAVILSDSAYTGRAPPNIWNWLKTKMESPPRG